MNSAEEKFKLYLKKKGLKYTPQRKKILKAVLSIQSHFDIDKLHSKVNKVMPSISKATIYRAMPLLLESALIREAMRCEGKSSYEHMWGHEHHDHLICVNCGRIIEFKVDKIEKLQNEICKKHGFLPLEHKLGIKGYCKKCRPNKKT